MTQGGTPLRGRRVLVTRAAEQASELIARLEAAGAEVVHLPAIRFVRPPTWDSLDQVIDEPDSWDLVVFTSTNGVAFFAERCRERHFEPASRIRAKVAAVGRATADALRTAGIVPDIVPERFSGSEIAGSLPDNQTGKRTAIVRALAGRDELIEELQTRGGEVHLAVAYETKGLDELPDDLRAALVEGRIDALTFTSPSTAENVLRHLSTDDLERVVERSIFVSIGPTTTAALRALGVEGVVEADESSVRGLVRALINSLQGGSRP